jgi:hypothetical protein
MTCARIAAPLDAVLHTLEAAALAIFIAFGLLFLFAIFNKRGERRDSSPRSRP